LEITPNQCEQLKKSVAMFSNPHHPLVSSMSKSAKMKTSGKGQLAASARRLLTSIGTLPSFAQKITTLNFEIPTPENDSPQAQFIAKSTADINMTLAMFHAGISRSGLLVIEAGVNLDTHDPASAKALPTNLIPIIAVIDTLFQKLSSTPSSGGRSMLDDTTVLIASEFSRTMRQKNVEFAQSGTDHNGLRNTLLVGGRGIRGGLILGASDYCLPDEVLSPAHVALDPEIVRVMGRPFDFSTFTQRFDNNQGVYDPYAYLTPHNVSNTIQDILGLDTKYRFAFGRETAAAKSLDVLKA